MSVKRIVIIGNSAAGTAAIEAVRKSDPGCFIVQLSDEAQPLYSRCLLSYYLAGTRTKADLAFRPADFHRQMDVDLRAGPDFKAVGLDRANREVICANGDQVSYDRLLVATGASAKLPDNIPGDIGGVYMLRTADDADAIKARLKGVKRAVVLGGGLIGIKAATALGRLGIKTTVVIRSNRVLSQMIDVDASMIITKQLKDNNIDVMNHTDVTEVLHIDKHVTGVKTDRGDTLECELLIVAKGVSPNTGLVSQAGIPVEWGIRTDQYMQTGDENVYAAGDVAETYDIALESHTVNALWTCAIQQGRIAGLNMMDRATAYDGTLGMNSLNVYDTSLISFGITAPKDESPYRFLTLNQPDRGVYKKIVLDRGHRVKGIILLGHIENAGVLLSLIRRKLDVSSFEEELLSDQFNYGKIVKYGDPAELERYHDSKLL